MPSYPSSFAYGTMPSGKGAAQPAGGKTVDFKSFFIRLGITAGSLTAVLLVFYALGFLSQATAILALIVGCLAMLGTYWSGLIWMIVIAWKDSPTQGLLVMLVPLYWLFYLAQNRQKCTPAVAVLVAALAPALMSLLMIQSYESKFTGGTSSRRLAGLHSPTRSQTAMLKQRLQERRNASRNPEVLRIATYKLQMFGNASPPANVEQALIDAPGYVPGSFQLDLQNKTASLQFRGDADSAPIYALLMPRSPNAFIFSAPVSVDEVATDATEKSPQL